jgi:MFS family permease
VTAVTDRLPDPRPVNDRYRWVALSNTTLGVLMVTINQSIVLIAMPSIFRGIGLNPLTPGNTSYLLWMLMGFSVVLAVLVVSLGRVGDMFGRVRMYNLGFAIFTLFAVLLSVTWMTGPAAAIWLITMRVLQAVGAAMLFANSSAILTDAFPASQRGLALGINNVAAIAGSFIGLVLGGLLAPVEWHLVFLVSVPFGLFGTVWAFLMLKDQAVRAANTRIDWWGNVTFGLGLVLVLVGITYGIQPYGHHTMGWTSPLVMGALAGGVVLLATFMVIETRVANPMFQLRLFRIRAFAMGNVATFLASLARGGLMFLLIIWLQGIWLPLHGYSFNQTPLWAGIYMLPLTVGFLAAGPVSGALSDRFGARPFATGGLLVASLSFILLMALPINFPYPAFAALILLNGLGMGAFAAPNQTGIMNSLPANQRGSGSGMSATFNSSAQVLSIGIFFSLMILGLAASLPHALYSGLTAQGVSAGAASRVSHLPPVGSLFAAFLGYNPLQTILGPATLAHLPAATAAHLTSRTYFPSLIALSFRHGLQEAFTFAAVCCLLGAGGSLLRGGKYVYVERGTAEVRPAARPGRGRRPEPTPPTATAPGPATAPVTALVAVPGDAPGADAGADSGARAPAPQSDEREAASAERLALARASQRARARSPE